MSTSPDESRLRAALEAGEAIPLSPAGVVEYRSRGRVLVIGGEEAREFAPRLRPELRPQVLLTGDEQEPGVPVISLGGRELCIEGHLGAFTVTVGESGHPGREVIECDLILDLDIPHHLQARLPPPGYLRAVPGEPSALDLAETELKGLVGRFEKARYVDYDPARCAHGRSGKAGCRRCLDACPAEAIVSRGERIQVDPYRCQGGGACAAVCPSGAIRYTTPPLAELGERIRAALRSWCEGGGDPPVVALVSGGDRPSLDPLPGRVLPFTLEEVAGAGPELWLAALAWGASAVRLVSPSCPDAIDAGLAAPLRMIGEILDALGLPAGCVALVTPERVADGDRMPSIRPAAFAPLGDKRQLLFLAVGHLHDQAPRAPAMTELSAGAFFGAAFVDGRRCTLCMACAGACPGHALQAGGEQPALRFIEANCLQCGICTRTCPEEAIWISPRLLFDPEARRLPRTLHEEPPFECVACGTPFATRRVIENTLRRLAAHPMFASERARRRLMMCEACRVADIVQDREAISAGLAEAGSPLSGGEPR